MNIQKPKTRILRVEPAAIADMEKQKFEHKQREYLAFAHHGYRERGRGAIATHWRDGKFIWEVYHNREAFVELTRIVELPDDSVFGYIDTYNPEQEFVVFIFVVKHTGDGGHVALTKSGVLGIVETML